MPGLFRAREERNGNLVVLGPVELKPSVARAGGGGDVFDGGGGGRGEDVGEAELGGDGCNADFFIGVEDLLHAYGGDDEGCVVGSAEKRDAEVAMGYWAEHAGD